MEFPDLTVQFLIFKDGRLAADLFDSEDGHISGDTFKCNINVGTTIMRFLNAMDAHNEKNRHYKLHVKIRAV